MEMCKCGEREVKVKKWGLCHRCYQRMRSGRRSEYYASADPKVIQVAAERMFAATFFHDANWVAQPAKFNLHVCTYCPDFWDGSRGVFIEVVGTSQAFYAGRDKYEMFKSLYPTLQLEFRSSDGRVVAAFDQGGKLSGLDTAAIEGRDRKPEPAYKSKWSTEEPTDEEMREAVQNLYGDD